MTALKKTLSKSWIAAAAAGALFASISALPAEAGGQDHFRHGQGGGHQGGFHGQQMQRPHMPHIPQRQPQFNRVPRVQQHFNPRPDQRIIHMQEQVRRMQSQTRRMQQMAIERQRMIYQQRIQRQQQFRLRQQWQQQPQWQQRHYHYNVNPRIYRDAPVYQQGPTRQDYDECAAVRQESNGCYIDTRGNIHYTHPQVVPQRDNGGAAAAQIILQTIETIRDVSQREQLQKQLIELEQKKKAVEAERDALLKKQGAQAIPEPTVESGELNGDEAPAKPKWGAPKPL